MSKIKFFSFKIADFLFVFLFVVTIIYFSANIFLNKKAKTKQLIIESGKNIWYYQLDKNKKIEIEGLLGKSLIIIQDGCVFFEDSPCPNKLCVLSNSICNNGDWIACLPNGVFARIEGEENFNQELDATSY